MTTQMESSSTMTTPTKPKSPQTPRPSVQSTPGSTSRRIEDNAPGNTTPSSATKLRRKVNVDDALTNVASIQRLVEYFVIVSCHPQWETNETSRTPKPASSTGAPATPESKRAPIMHRVVSPPIATAPSKSGKDAPVPISPSGTRKNRLGKSIGNTFRKRDKSRSGLRISKDDSSLPVIEAREDLVQPPKPRETWKRDEQEATEGNIHMPQNDGSDEYTFQPKVTSRYPLKDHQDNPLNPMVTQFCHPAGDVVVPTKEYQMPRVHHFVLTNDKGRKIYGTCLTILEEYESPDDAPWRAQNLVHSDSGERDIEVTVDNEESTLYLPRCLCILSMWPYMTAFREYLAQLYRLATSTDCMKAPIERYIMNLCMEIPAPPPGAFEVQINILDSVIRFWSPPAKLPIAYVALPYQILFDCLDVDNILYLWYCLAMEQKVLLVSSQYSILTVCSEILCSLLYPMKWSHLYVPLLPRFLCPMLDAPVPYLCGVIRDNWLHVQQFVSDETIVVDLDRNSIMFGEQTPDLPALPGKKWTKLQNTLEEIVGHLFWRTRGLEMEYRQNSEHKLNQSSFKEAARQTGELRWNEKLVTFDQAFNLQFTPDSENLPNSRAIATEQNQWDRVQEAFLRFFVALLKDYRRFLDVPDVNSSFTPTPEPGDWLQWNMQRSFDRDGFIKSQKAEYTPYLSDLTLTQQFDDFITKRLCSPEMPDIIFFDQSIDAKLNRSRFKLKKVDTPFLQSAKAHKVLKTFLAVEPDTSGLVMAKPFMYKTWPETLDLDLFGSPRPIPTIITAEFDRQAALISRLRNNHSAGRADNTQLIDFYGSDYDTSPEGMVFTVFFFAYSSIIGREWQAYQQKRKELDTAAHTQVDTDPKTSDHTQCAKGEECIEIENVTSEHLFSDISLGICDVCPSRAQTVNDALVYVTTSPCPRQIDDFNVQAQNAFENISKLTNSPFKYLNRQRSASLLDDDDVFAEYEEAREVAVAQLDLAFDTFKTMEMRDLLADPDVYKSLMAACGRCGDTKRALELIEMMKRDGLVADQEVLSCFMAAFSHTGDTPGETAIESRRGSDAYSTFLKKKLNFMGRDATDGTTKHGLPSDSDAESGFSDVASTSGSELSGGASELNLNVSPTLFNWFTSSAKKAKRSNKKRMKRRRRHQRYSTMDATMPTADLLMKQIVLGESLLDFLYPELTIEVDGDSCPQCSHVMAESEIITGWRPCQFQDFTTRCPHCQHRFVPRFSVASSSPTFEGSQGFCTPLHCEFLSPWVLRKELSHLVDGGTGIDLILNPDWRSGTDIRATIWWNLIAMFKRYELPFSFLLQGSFQNRLINPVPQDH